jgi:hypothetical protein
MAHVIQCLSQVSQMTSAVRAITVVSVPWSVTPRKSRELMANLEATRASWSPHVDIEFFDIWPEREDELNRWYEEQCQLAWPMFELHGHGHGPLWWHTNGRVLGCLTKPYELPLEEIQRKSTAFFQ